MYIKSIYLNDFRNLKEQEISFSPTSNAIIGDNAQGKTNIIEAIYLTSRGKSFRAKDINLIQQGKQQAKIIINFVKDNREQKIEIRILENKKKIIVVNGIQIKKYTELFGVLNVVFFSPEDLAIIKGGPYQRRRFIDREISSVDNKYLKDLIYYNKIIGERNKLLKMARKDRKELQLMPVYDQQLAVYAQKIINKRELYLQKINEYCQEIHSTLSANQETINIEYMPTVGNQTETIIKQLAENLEQDLKYGYSRLGPHKDDFLININQQNSRIYASQGQQRTAALALKLSEIKLFEEKFSRKPILLLDDVMSELDSKRQTMIIKEIKNTQTILTTTDLHGLNSKELMPFYKIVIDKGQILLSEECL